MKKKKKNKRKGPRPGSMRIDARADHLLDLQVSDGPDSEWLAPPEVAKWLRYSEIWLKLSRIKGTGPAYKKINSRVIRYKRGEVKKWLRMRTQNR